MENTVGRLCMELHYLSKLFLYAFLLMFRGKKEGKRVKKERKIRKNRDERITACSHKYKTEAGEKERASKGEKIEPNSLILNYYLSIMESEWSPGAAQQQRIRKDLWALRGPVLPSAACSAPRGCRGAAASACLIIYP